MVTFTRKRLTYNPATDQSSTQTVTTITGAAIQVRGTPATYDRLELVQSTSPTLFFTPTNYGLYSGDVEFVLPGDTVVWANQNYTVADVDPIAPDGFVIAARIVVKK